MCVGEDVGDGWRACGKARLEMAECDLGPSIMVSELRLSLLSNNGWAEGEEGMGLWSRLVVGGGTSAGRSTCVRVGDDDTIASVGGRLTRVC